jgi:hypothetical protein
MISPKEEYIHIITHRLKENWKSFNILYKLKHYGNCISIMCQELDQIIRLLFLIKSRSHEKILLINLAINSQKWYLIGGNNKKEFITEDVLMKFTKSLSGWERSIYEFGFSFKSLTNNFNYLLKDPLLKMKKNEREKIFNYITEYHVKDLPIEFTLNDIIPVLPLIFEKLSENLRSYISQL